MDGNIKISKEVGGYDDANDHHGDDSNEEGSQAHVEDPTHYEDGSKESQDGDQ